MAQRIPDRAQWIEELGQALDKWVRGGGGGRAGPGLVGAGGVGRAGPGLVGARGGQALDKGVMRGLRVEGR